MIRQDFYTGEPVTWGSPYFSAESEAANMASFGKYDYSPDSRQNIQQQPMQQNQQFYNQPMTGIGSPYVCNGYQQYSPYGNLLPLNRQFQQPVQQPTSYHVPGINPGGSEFLPPANWQEMVDDLQLEYWKEKQEVDVQSEMNMQQSVYGNSYFGAYNYYGMPYYNSYKYNAIDNKFSEKVRKIKDEARQNRINLNIQMSKLAHNILGDGVSEEDIIQRCTGYDVPAPQMQYSNPQDYYTQIRINNMVPFDNSGYYRKIRADHIKEVQEILPPDSNLEETFKNLGVLMAKYEMEEEMHRRKDLSGTYASQDNMYKYYVRRKARERYAAEQGLNYAQDSSQQQQQPNPYVNFGNQILNCLPTLSKNATISDDGTLNVSLSLPSNVGSHKGEIYTVSNQNEAEYEKKREQFGKFLNTIKSDIYLDGLKQKKFDNTTFI